MTAEEFRRIALGFPETEERSHMGHPDFRVGGKIYATIGPDEDWGMTKLTAEQQEFFLRTEPKIFEPASGAWGRRGATIIKLAVADEHSVRQALNAAWRNTATKRVIEKFDGHA